MASIYELELESSLTNWFPKISNDLPVPITEILPVDEDERIQLYGMMDGNAISRNLELRIRNAAQRIGYPLFIRTDQASSKHDFKDAALIRSPEDLMSRVYSTIEFNINAGIVGLDWRALVFRRFMDINAPFMAFNFMPVGRERRYFVKDGEVLCHHPYWVEGAIDEWDQRCRRRPNDGASACRLPADWKTTLAALNVETPEEITILTDMAQEFSNRVPGYWSVDFAQFKTGETMGWFFIDAARGELSWHPEDCPHCYKALDTSTSLKVEIDEGDN